MSIDNDRLPADFRGFQIVRFCNNISISSTSVTIAGTQYRPLSFFIIYVQKNLVLRWGPRLLPWYDSKSAAGRANDMYHYGSVRTGKQNYAECLSWHKSVRYLCNHAETKHVHIIRTHN